MSLHVVETGEIVEEMTRIEAERITSRIADKLDTIADNLEQVLPLIGEALTREAWRALGYNSPTAYVSERFAGALTRLPVEVRRPVVAQLSAAGMSTRAIAPIVGKDQSIVTRDIQTQKHVMQNASPEPVDEPQPAPPVEAGTITGLDGKQYDRPAPKPEHAPRPDSITKQFTGAIAELNRLLDKLHRISQNPNYDRNKEQVATLHGSDLTRAISELQTLADNLN